MYKSIFLCTFIILYTSVFWNTSIFCYLGKRFPNHKCEESHNLEVEVCCSILIMMTLQIPFFCMRCAIAVLLSISISMIKQWWRCVNLSTATFAVICTFWTNWLFRVPWPVFVVLFDRTLRRKRKLTVWKLIVQTVQSTTFQARVNNFCLYIIWHAV